MSQIRSPINAPNCPSDVIDDKDVLTLLAVVLILVAIYQIGKVLLVHPPPFVRVQLVQGPGDPCRVEVWVEGKPGDHLFRLRNYNRRGKSWLTGIAIVSPTGDRTELATEAKTDRGECRIERYHLLVNGQEVDSVAGMD
jgi:hypothetical protein